MRVWITRPAAQAVKTQALLASLANSLGDDALTTWVQPVMSIRPLPELSPPQRQQLLDLDQYHFAIFVSQNAVAFGMSAIDQFWPQLPEGIQWLAVGQASAKALVEQGLDAMAPTSAMDTEALLELPALEDLRDQKIIIFKGVGGRTTMAELLSARGARVDYCELYQRVRQEQATDALRASNFGLEENDLTLAYSGESVEYILATVEQAGRLELLNRLLIVPGARVAAIAHKRGFKQVVVAENATDQAMLKPLTNVLNQ